MSLKLALVGDQSLKRLLSQLGDKRTEYAVVDIAKSPAREIVRRAKKKIPRGTHGEGFLGAAHRAGTARRGIKTKRMLRTKGHHKMVGQYVQVPGGRRDWFYFFHNARPKTNRSGKGQIADPWGDVIEESAKELDQTTLNSLSDKIIKVLRRQVQKAIR